MSEKEKSEYHIIAEEIADLVEEKNKAYGNSFELSDKFLKLLWPNGVPSEQYSDMLTIIRIWDKLKRISTDKNKFNEDPFSDILGYALLALKKQKQNKKTIQKRTEQIDYDSKE